jgi:hypothetical protein
VLRIGIDNGLDGAIVAINQDYHVLYADLMPVIKVGTKRTLDMRAFYALLREMCGDHHNVFAVLEKAQAMPKQGGVSMFNYGTGYGAAQMALIGLDIPHEIVRPQAWQKQVGITRGDTKGQAIGICRRRLPSLELVPGRKRVPHIGLGDAGCMSLHAAHLRPFPVYHVVPAPPPPPRSK